MAASNPAGEVVQFTSELIQIDTTNFGTGEGPGERRAAEYCAEKLAEVGLDCEIEESAPGRANVMAHWEPEGCDTSVAPLLIHMHNDVVPANADDWSVDPFSGEIKDGCVWGRGAVDMKDFNAMVLSVVRDRQRTGRAPRRPIRLVFTADEEAGSVYGAQWIVENHPDWVADCTEAIGEVGGFSVTVRDDLRLYLVESAEKGIHWLKLIADGTAGHGSMRNHDNAVTELAAAVARIGRYDWPMRLHPAQRAFLDTVSEALEVEITADNVEETLARLGSVSRMIGATMSHTVNPTMLQAGYKTNVIPGQAVAYLDARTIPGFEDEFLATIKELCGPKVRAETVIDINGIETEFAGGLVEAMKHCIEAEDPNGRAVEYLMSAGTDGKAWNHLGVRCFGFTPLQLPADLDFVGMFHGVDERVPTDALEFGARVLDRFLDEA